MEELWQYRHREKLIGINGIDYVIYIPEKTMITSGNAIFDEIMLKKLEQKIPDTLGNIHIG